MTVIEKVRLLIADTGSAQFDDTQIQAFLDLASNDVLMAASYALEAWAAALTDTSLKSEKIGDYSYSKDVVGAKTALAEKYRKESAMAPAQTWSEPDYTTSGSGITVEGD